MRAVIHEGGQAEAIAAQLREAAGADHTDLATKADIAALRESVNHRFNFLQWVVGIQSAITLATFAVVVAKLL